MRGIVDQQLPLFHTFEVEDRIPPHHPLRDIKSRTTRILEGLHPKFEAAYSSTGRPGVPPERLLKALLLMTLYSVRSERQLCEQIDLNLLFRWFLDLQPSDDAFDATTFTKNRERLETHGLTKAFFDAVVAEALAKDLCSEHFSVDGTLIESFASAKSFQPRDSANRSGTATEEQPQNDSADEPHATPDEPNATVNEPNDPSDMVKEPHAAGNDAGTTPTDSNGFKPSNPDIDFHGQKRTNETHQSRTDPEAKLYRKGRGKEAKLSHMGHVLTENRNGLIVTITATEANGTAERTATIDMLDDLKETHDRKPKTLGGDKGYDDGEFFRRLEDRKIEPHIPLVKDPVDPKTVKDKKRLRGIRARRRMKRRMGTEAYRLSQRCRKKVEESFGWMKTVGGMGRSRVVGRWKLRQLLEVSAAAFNLVRMRRLAPVAV